MLTAWTTNITIKYQFFFFIFVQNHFLTEKEIYCVQMENKLISRFLWACTPFKTRPGPKLLPAAKCIGIWPGAGEHRCTGRESKPAPPHSGVLGAAPAKQMLQGSERHGQGSSWEETAAGDGQEAGLETDRLW